MLEMSKYGLACQNCQELFKDSEIIVEQEIDYILDHDLNKIETTRHVLKCPYCQKEIEDIKKARELYNLLIILRTEIEFLAKMRACKVEELDENLVKKEIKTKKYNNIIEIFKEGGIFKVNFG